MGFVGAKGEEFPLAGDINWMETHLILQESIYQFRSHSLGTLIEWKHIWYAREYLPIPFPLAGDINWIEILDQGF
jgi:hypothetical protein